MKPVIQFALNCRKLQSTDEDFNKQPISVANSCRLLLTVSDCRRFNTDKVWICVIFWSWKGYGKSVLKKRVHPVYHIEAASTDLRYRLGTFGRWAFAVAGPTFWNSLADELRTYFSDRFKLALKTFLST